MGQWAGRDDRCKAVPGELPGLAEDWLWDERVREREVSKDNFQLSSLNKWVDGVGRDELGILEAEQVLASGAGDPGLDVRLTVRHLNAAQRQLYLQVLSPEEITKVKRGKEAYLIVAEEYAIE